MTKDKHSIPIFLLEQLALGELSTGAERQLRDTHGEHAVNEALFVLQQSNNHLREADFSAPLIRAVEQNVARKKRLARSARSTSWSLAMAPALAAALVWLSVNPMGDAEQTPSQAHLASLDRTASPAIPLELTRLKGDSQSLATKATAPPKQGAGELLIYRRVAEGESSKTPSDPSVEQLQQGDEVRQGDVLQMGYVSNYDFGTLLSLDGRGQVTLHWPGEANVEPQLPNREGLLGFSYELDDSPEFERFFFVTSPKSFSVKAVAEAAKKLGQDSDKAARNALPVAAGLFVTSLTLKKVSR